MPQEVSKIGLTACANAKRGGFLIDIERFAVTEATGFTANTQDSNLEGTIVYEGAISSINAMSGEPAVEFVCEIPIGVPASGILRLGEVGLFLASGEMFSHGTVVPIYDKDNSFGLRFSIIVALAGLSDVVNVTITNTNSIPSVAYVRSLPRPIDGPENTVAVLDEWQNPDSSYSPSLAIKYGPGATRWGYVGYDRVYEGVPDSTDSTDFVLDPESHGFTMEMNEQVIVQEVVNGNAGHSHRYIYKGKGKFTLFDGNPGIVPGSVLGVWRRLIPNITNCVKIDCERFGYTTVASGVYALQNSVEKENSYAIAWVDGLFHSGAQATGKSLTVAGATAGLPLEGCVFRLTPVVKGEDPDYIKVEQYDFPAVTKTTMPLPFKPEGRQWVFVFREGKLLPDARWDVYGVDITLKQAADADGKNYQVVVFHKKTRPGGFSFDVATHKQDTSGVDHLEMGGLLSSSDYLFFAKGLLQDQYHFEVDADNSVVNLFPASFYPAGVETKLVQFKSSGGGYFFSRSDDVGDCFNDASISNRKIELQRKNGDTVILNMPPNLTIVPVGESYDITEFDVGLNGFDAYDSPDMPVLDESTKYFHGVVSRTEGNGKNPGGVQGFQLAVGVNTELNVARGAYIRIKDETQSESTPWRRLAWADEIPNIIPDPVPIPDPPPPPVIPLEASMVSDPIKLTQNTTGSLIIAKITSGIEPYLLSCPDGLALGITDIHLDGTDIIATYDIGLQSTPEKFDFYVYDSGSRKVKLTANIQFLDGVPFTIQKTISDKLEFKTTENGNKPLANVTPDLGPYTVVPNTLVKGVALSATSDGVVSATYTGANAVAGTYDMIYTISDKYKRKIFGKLKVIVTEVLPPLPAPTTFDSAGTYTYTVPAGVYKIQAVVEGGGGSGGNGATGYFIKTEGTPISGAVQAGGGGGGGAGTNKACVLTVTPGDKITVVIGAGGAQNPNVASLNYAPKVFAADQIASIHFPNGFDGEASYISKPGSSLPYVTAAGGTAGQGGKAALKSVATYGNYGTVSFSWKALTVGVGSAGGLGGIGGVNGNIQAENGHNAPGGSQYGGAGGKGGDSSTGIGGAGGRGGIDGGSGSECGSDGQPGGPAAGGGGGGGDGYGAAWIHGRGNAGGDGIVTITPTR